MSSLVPNIICLLPGTDVTIYCALPDSSVTWANAELGSEGTSTHAEKANLGPDIQLCFISVEHNQDRDQTCTNASATINNVPKTLDGFNVTCATNTKDTKVSKLFVISVIGKTNDISYYGQLFSGT